MDFMTVAVGLGVCIVAAGVLFLISVFSFKERTFEEALAEQQKYADSLLKVEKAGKEKEKKPKKAVKKNKDKEREKEKEKDKTHAEPSIAAPQPVLVDSAVEEKAHVEFEPDPEIIPEESISTPPAEKEKRKSDKKEKVKPILRNREGHSPAPASPVVESPFVIDSADSVNHFLEHPPKDVIELKNKDSKHGTKTKGATKSVTDTPAEIPVVEPVAVKEVAFIVGGKSAAPLVSSAAPSATTAPSSAAAGQASTSSSANQGQHGTPKKQQRKKNAGNKSDSLDAVDDGEELLLLLGGTEKLLSAARRVPLSAAELQTMIEVLLNRQQEADGAVESEWMERGGRLDPLSSLKKQLADKEKALKEEQEVTVAYQNKLKTLGAEMATERTRSAAARKQLEESLARQTSEVQALAVKLSQATEQHAAEVVVMKNTLQHIQKSTQISEDNVHQLQRLQEENGKLNALYDSSQKLAQELGARSQQLEELLRHNEQKLDGIMQVHEQQRRDQEAQFQNQLTMMSAQLQEAEKAMLMRDSGQVHEVQIHNLREALAASESQALMTARDAQARLEEMERTKQLMEDRITTVERDLILERNIVAQKENEAKQEMARLRDENNLLHDRAADFQTHRDVLAQQQNAADQEVARIRQENQLLSDRLAATEHNLQEVARLTEVNRLLQERVDAVQLELAKEGDLGQEVVRLRTDNQLKDERLAAAEKEVETQRDQVAQKQRQLDQEVGRLQDENKSLHERLASAQGDLDTARDARNQSELSGQELDSLREMNQTIQEELVKSREAKEAAEKASADTLETVIKEKDAELEAQKQKNNELREKNYKVMDALASTEKSLVELKKSSTAAAAASASSPAQTQERFVALLQRIFPDAVLNASASEESFGQEVVTLLTSSIKRIEEEEHVKAYGQVLHYKTVLGQTEELLNRLQSRIEAEEQSWKAQTGRLESEVKAAQKERDFWLEQCQKQEELQESKAPAAPVAVDVGSLQTRIESLQQLVEQERRSAADVSSQLAEKQTLLLTVEQSLEEERQAVIALRQQLEQNEATGKVDVAPADSSQELIEKRKLLQVAEELLAQERQANHSLREQLDQVKSEMAAAKVGSIGFMVGWSKAAHSSAASVAVATAATRNNNGSLESLITPPETDMSTMQQVNSTKMDSAATNGNGNGAAPPSQETEVASHFAS